MKKLILFHNPRSGDAGHDRENIVASLEDNGYTVEYFNMKKDWKNANLNEGADLLVVAGGDGTSRKLVGWLLETGLIKKKIPITILPLGTANNLSKTFGINGSYTDLVPKWPTWHQVPYDLGLISTKSETDNSLYFLEAMGCGLFVAHLQNNQKGSSGIYKDDPEKKIAADLEKLRIGLASLKPVEVRILVDGIDHSGTYLSVSVMSSRHLGTNLDFNPGHHPGDGQFEVVLIPISDRDLLEQFILDHSKDAHKNIRFKTLSGSEIRLSSSDHVFHLDDELYNVTGGGELVITASKTQLIFLAPGEEGNGNH